MKELPFVDDAGRGVAAFMKNLSTHMAELIARAQAAGELDAEPPPILLAQNLFAIYFSILQRWLGGDVDVPNGIARCARRSSSSSAASGARPAGEPHGAAARDERPWPRGAPPGGFTP